jgi:histidinol phosphatase-like enzyme (inositol monophosphatase family)
MIAPVEIARFLNSLCERAARETLPRFRTQTKITNKNEIGFDPVTHADKEAERVIREEILRTFPDHGILGEEHGAYNSDADYQWIIDPIDGTRAFISGIPVWGTLIGLFHKGKPLAGVMDQPFTGERFLCDGEISSLTLAGQTTPLKTSDTQSCKNALLMTTAPELYHGVDATVLAQLTKATRLTRYGADCYAFCMLAAGHVDIVMEAGVHLHDVAALIAIIEHAGGVMTDWQGNPISKAGNVIASANQELHKEALMIIAESYKT